MAGGARVTVHDLEEEFGLGELVGTYPLETVSSVFNQVILGIVVVGYASVAIVVGGIALSTGSPVSGGLLLASVAVLVGLYIWWRKAAVRHDLHRCLTFEAGIVTTGWTGHARSWILLTEITRVAELRVLQYGFHANSGFTFTRADGSSLYLSVRAKDRALLADIARLRTRVRGQAPA